MSGNYSAVLVFVQVIRLMKQHYFKCLSVTSPMNIIFPNGDKLKSTYSGGVCVEKGYCSLFRGGRLQTDLQKIASHDPYGIMQ